MRKIKNERLKKINYRKSTCKICTKNADELVKMSKNLKGSGLALNISPTKATIIKMKM